MRSAGFFHQPGFGPWESRTGLEAEAHPIEMRGFRPQRVSRHGASRPVRPLQWLTSSTHTLGPEGLRPSASALA